MSTAPGPDPQRRLAAPWVAVILGGILILAGVAVFLALRLGGGVLGGSAASGQTYTDQISRIGLHGGAGSIDVRAGGTPGSVEVAHEVHWGPLGMQPTPDESVSSGVLNLAARCEGFLSWCSVDYTITVPDGTAVTVDQGSGAVRLTGALGTIEAKTGSGSVTVSGAGTNPSGATVRLETGSGGISATGLRASQIYAHTGSGGIDLEVALAADSLRAETGSGGVTVRVPQGAYAVTVRTGSGSQQVNVTNDPASPHHIQAMTGSGGVVVGYR